MDQPMPKRPQSNSSAQDTLFYLIYEHCGGAAYSYSFYKIDLCDGSSGTDEDVKPLPPPLFLLDAERFPHGMSILKVEQQILMFGGQLSPDVFVYDTSTQHTFVKDEVPANLITKLPQMLEGKLCPIALTVGTRIYVLSGTFNRHYSYNPSPRFEVFYMENQRRLVLPEPLFPEEDVDAAPTVDNYEILAYASVHDSTIIVSMPIGIFMCTVSGEVGWRKVSTLGGVDRLPFGQGAEYMNGMWFALEGNRLRAYDFTNTEDGLINALDVSGMECVSEYDSEYGG